MTRITFKNENAHVAFHGMAEGMWDNVRDDTVQGDIVGQIKMAMFESLIGATAWQEGGTYPLTFDLSAEHAAAARDVIDNIDDNERLDNEDYDPGSIILGEPATQTLANAMDAREGLATVLDFAARFIENQMESLPYGNSIAAETTDAELLEMAKENPIYNIDTKTEAYDYDYEMAKEIRDYLRAARTVEGIILQRGCEHLAPLTSPRVAESGKLTDAIDCIMFG